MSPDRAGTAAPWQKRLDELTKQLNEASRAISNRLTDPSYQFEVDEYDALALLGDTVTLWIVIGLSTAQEHSDDPSPTAGTPAGEAMSALVMISNWTRGWGIDALPPGDANTDAMLSGVETLISALRKVLDLSITTNRDNPLIRSRLGLLETRWSSLVARRAATRVRAVEAAVGAAAGVVGEGELAKTFASYAADQGRRSISWLVLTVLLLVVVVGIGAALLRNPAAQSWQEVVAHLLVAAPAVGLAPYAARESSRRREEAARARLLRTQLQSINAYRAQLNPEHAENLLYDFGRYVYGPYVRPGDNVIDTLPSNALDTAANIIKKLPGS